MSALDTQVGGDHYKKLQIQPVELAYYLGATPCFTKLAKYIIRDKGSVSENFKKAKHIITLETTLSGFAEKQYKDSTDIGVGIYSHWIYKFTEDAHLRECLMCMYERNYRTATLHLEGYCKENNINI